MEEGLASRLIQVGVRALTAHLRAQAERFGVEVYSPASWHDAVGTVHGAAGPVYISLDLDVLEPMLAPGVSHPEPGGLTVREVLEVLAAVRSPVVGADIVEYNPRNDVRDLTARVAARFVKEIVGLF
jgi:arginase family enzyme